MTRQLQGKVAIVTGAGRGIGRAVAVGFANAGCAVCCSARTGSEIEDTVACIHGSGGQAIARTADVNNYDAVESMFGIARESFGGIDIVVVNAGISMNASVEDGSPGQWREVLQTNLIGAYHTARAAIPYLRTRGGGTIIFIGSGLGHRGVQDTSAYACSKAGVWSLTRVLAQELMSDGICVNELIPGPVHTAINSQDAEELRAQLGQSEWVKTPDDVVPLALFLATQPQQGPTAQSFSLMRRDG